MISQIPSMLQALEAAHFPHAVAIRPARDPELGAILEADALDVPAAVVLATHEVLSAVLWPCAFSPTTVLAGVYDHEESVAVRAYLPNGTVWYVPGSTMRSSTP